MRVADLMTRGAELVSPDATVQDAARTMVERGVGAVLAGSGRTLEGVLTDRDIILRVIVDGGDPTRIHVRDVMSTRTLFTCFEDDDAITALKGMRDHQVRRLPVLSRDGRLVGIIALCDLAKLLPRCDTAVEALREITEPHRRNRPCWSQIAATLPPSVFPLH